VARLILIKHAAPDLRSDVPPDRWVLSAAGQESCRWLAADLRGQGVRRLYASLQPKALETAARVGVELGLEVRPREDLRENDRTGLGFGSAAELERMICRFFEEPDVLVMGRETANAAHARFGAAVRAIADQSAGETVAVVAHGAVITLFVAARSGAHPFPLWKQLALASWVVLEGPDLRWDGMIHGRRPEHDLSAFKAARGPPAPLRSPASPPA
jgi:broad specificity phosphatase PhoE